MINFEKQFEKMDKEYDKMYEKYLEYKENITYATRQELLRQAKKFSESKRIFVASVKNLYLKEGETNENTK